MEKNLNLKSMKIIDANNLLSSLQVSLLMNSASLPFSIGKFSSLADILSSLKVDVIIDPDVAYRKYSSEYLDKAEEYWTKKREEARFDEGHGRSSAMISDFLGEIRRMRDGDSLLLGCYKPDENVVILYPNAMAQVENCSIMDELLVTTFAHETMHAYFNRPKHKKFPYVLFVEEPLAEFGMLLYLKETANPIYDWAYDYVRFKYSIYRIGARLMSEYLDDLSNGVLSQIRDYLVAYKIMLDPYEMLPYSNYDASLPCGINSASQKNVSVGVSGTKINAKWQDVFENPPRYFYDKATDTLGLDGDWDGDRTFHDVDIWCHLEVISHGSNNIYLGDNFKISRWHRFERLFSSANVIVSSRNKIVKSVNGIPVSKVDNEPVLPDLGDGYYEITRNGKDGVVDSELNIVVPCKYDCIWSMDKNDLFVVRLDDKYGLVNAAGIEVFPVIYEDVSSNKEDGTYTVKRNGEILKFDKYGYFVG